MGKVKYAVMIAVTLAAALGISIYADHREREALLSAQLEMIGFVEANDSGLAEELITNLYGEAFTDYLAVGKEALEEQGYGQEGQRLLYHLYGTANIRWFAVFSFVGILLLWMILALILQEKNSAQSLKLFALREDLQRCREEKDYYEEGFRTEQGKANLLIENISHQIRTPLMSITLYLEIVEEEKLSAEGRDTLKRCFAHITHIANLITCLMRTGELEQNKVHFYFEPIRLKDFMEEVTARAKEQNPFQDVVLSGKNTDISIWIDTGWIKEALLTLIENCQKYSRTEEPVEVSYYDDGHFVYIHIRDRGIGISGKDLPHIFDRFYRSESNRRQDGFGIGLNMAKLVIEAHHGKISVDSGPEGSCFKIFVPTCA